MEESDEELTAILIATLDTTIYGELIRRNQSLIRGMLYRLTGNRAISDDLAQDTFFHSFERLDQFKGSGSFKSWLCQIAYSKFLMAVRRSKIANKAQQELIRITYEGDTESDFSIEVDVSKAISVLSEIERSCVIMCYMADFSHSEIASELGIPLGTVKSHIRRGREKLAIYFSSSPNPNSEH